jgi:pimeloyl-ACP methyl ester carboxylesterase
MPLTKRSIRKSLLFFAGLLALLLFSNCSTPREIAAATQKQNRSVILFIPGYYGSTLKDTHNGRRVFVTIGEMLFGATPLSLYNEELKTPKAPDLEVEGVLGSVSVIPGIYGINVYGAFLKELQKSGREVIPFAYDWRLDLPETARHLHDTIETLRGQGVTRIDLVAHSMGCLVTAYYLAYGGQSPDSAALNWAGANNIDKAVLMAGPYGGAFVLFRNMQRGATLQGNRTYLPADALSSLPSSYQLLPFSGDHILDENGHPVSLSMTDAKTWESLHLGLLRRQELPPEVLAKRTTFLRNQLARARKFSELLKMENAATPPPPHLRILQLIGTGRPMVDAGYYKKSQGEFVFDSDQPARHGLTPERLFQEGDGSVTRTSAVIPEALRPVTKTLYTPNAHEIVFEDAAFKKELHEFLK